MTDERNDVMLASSSHPNKNYLQLRRGAQAIEGFWQPVISNILLPPAQNLCPTHISYQIQFTHQKNIKGEENSSKLWNSYFK